MFVLNLGQIILTIIEVIIVIVKNGYRCCFHSVSQKALCPPAPFISDTILIHRLEDISANWKFVVALCFSSTDTRFAHGHSYPSFRLHYR